MHFTRMCLGLLSARDIVTMCVKCVWYVIFIVLFHTRKYSLASKQCFLILRTITAMTAKQTARRSTMKIEHNCVAIVMHIMFFVGRFFLPPIQYALLFLIFKIVFMVYLHIGQTILFIIYTNTLCNIVLGFFREP